MREPEIWVWFSCGAASAVAAYLTIQQYGSKYRVRVINNPVTEEHADNLRFMADCEKWFGQPIERSVHRDYPNASAVEVWARRMFMSGPKGAPCTDILKKKARGQFEENNGYDWNIDWMVFGFTADEQDRHNKFVLTERNNVLPVLINAEMTKQDCIDFVTSHGIMLPFIYNLGFPNANCIGCVKATSPTYWNHVRKHFPLIFWQRALMSRIIGVRLVRYKGQRIFLDELPEDAAGRPLASMKMPDCGLFCEEWQAPEHDNA